MNDETFLGRMMGGRLCVPAAFVMLLATAVRGQVDDNRTGTMVVDERLLATLSLPANLAAMQFSNDGSNLAIATAGGEIRLWDISESEARERPGISLDEPATKLTELAFSQDGGFLAAADIHRVWVWRVEDGALVNSSQLVGRDSFVTRLAYSDRALVVVDDDRSVSRLDATSLEPLAGNSVYMPDVKAISANGRFCVRTSAGKRLSVWDLEQHRLLPLSIPTCQNDLFAISPDGKTVVLAGVDWDGRRRDTGQPQDGVPREQEKGPWDTIDGGVWTLDTEDGEKRRFRDADRRPIQSLSYSSDGSCLGVALADQIDFTYQGEDAVSIPRRLSLFRPPVAAGATAPANDFALSPSWPPRVAWQKSEREVELWMWDVHQEDAFRKAYTAAQRSGADARSAPAPPDPFFEYTVFYGTNRQPRATDRPFWLDQLISFVRDEAGLLLAGFSGVVLVFTLLIFAIFRTLTLGRMMGLVLLALLFYGGSAAVHTLLVLRHDPTNPGEYYGNERGELRYGSVQVTIPNNHEYGKLEGPIWFLTADPGRDIVLQQVDAAEGRLFLERLQREVAGGDTFVFIHGFNVSFEDAARRTAQMAYDLKFQGVPIFFSWPSKASMFGYTQDANNSDLAGVQLNRFLSDIEKYAGARRIHLIAHSMGTRVLSNALLDMGPERLDGSKFREIILAAPDIDAEYFRYGIAPAIVPTNPGPQSRRVTVYASSADKALLLSKQVNGYPRAGDAENLVVYPGLDTIDVSSLGDMSDATGHSYYGGLPDLFELLSDSKPPANRHSLTGRSDRELPYWEHLPVNDIPAAPADQPQRTVEKIVP